MTSFPPAAGVHFRLLQARLAPISLLGGARNVERNVELNVERNTVRIKSVYLMTLHFANGHE